MIYNLLRKWGLIPYVPKPQPTDITCVEVIMYDVFFDDEVYYHHFAIPKNASSVEVVTSVNRAIRTTLGYIAFDVSADWLGDRTLDSVAKELQKIKLPISGTYNVQDLNTYLGEHTNKRNRSFIDGKIRLTVNVIDVQLKS